MKVSRVLVPSALAALLLAACGGGGTPAPAVGPSGAPTAKGTFTSIVAFGDSLTDGGTYTVATQTGVPSFPYLGGKFSNNQAGGKVWVENIATSLNIVLTPAVGGFATTVFPCPAAIPALGGNPALANTCTNYAQGGSRVTNPAGIGNKTATGAAAALTFPVKKQLADHLAKRKFADSDLIFVYAGNNDIFAQFSAFAAKAGAIQADAATGKITADQANTLLFAAQGAGLTELKAAAGELATYVDQILANGGKYVVVMNLPDSAKTPFGSTVPVSARSTLTGFVDSYNQWLAEALTGKPVLWIDAGSLVGDAVANPSKYGLTNVTAPACDAAKISALTGGQVTDGSSLFCNSTPGVPFNGIRTGADVNTWLFADGVHPTTGGHKVFADAVFARLKAQGWVQ